jgi:hypothetical protein
MNRLRKEENRIRYTSILQGLWKRSLNVFVCSLRFERNPGDLKHRAAKKTQEKSYKSIKPTKHIHHIQALQAIHEGIIT